MRILLFTGFYLSDLKTTVIRRAIGTDARIAVTNDLWIAYHLMVLPELAVNTQPTLHVVFVYRIFPMKILDYALDLFYIKNES